MPLLSFHSRRPKITASVQRASSTRIGAAVTPTARADWECLEPSLSDSGLLHHLEQLYWIGVKGELETIIRTLRAWHRDPLSGETLNEEIENDDGERFVHGFDTFVDSVAEESRAFARRYGEIKARKAKEKKRFAKPDLSYSKALYNRAKDIQAEQSSSTIKNGVRRAIEGLSDPIPVRKDLLTRFLREDTRIWTGLERRARMLLNSTGFLDIEKLIEHRPPLKGFTFWKRPNIPQLSLSRFDKYWRPIFIPLRCSACNTAIRGCTFYNAEDTNIVNSICEDCYRAHHYGQDKYVKMYKHCILAHTINPTASRNICRCSTVPHFDQYGRSRALFPVEAGEEHLDINGSGSMQCGILKLGDLVALAKYEGMRTIVGGGKSANEVWPALKDLEKEEQRQSGHKKGTIKTTHHRSQHLRAIQGSSLTDPTQRTAHTGSTTVADDEEAEKDIPLFFRKYTEKYPFGNVHMSLRVGPLLIENGAEHAKRGALVTIRDLPTHHRPFEPGESRKRSLALSGGPDRSLWTQQRPREGPKRYKAVMKQIIGVPFTGILDQDLEQEIIRHVITASQRRFDDPGLRRSEQRKLIDQAVDRLVVKLRALLEPRLKIYLSTIASQLMDPSTKLTWSATENNCQNFCDALISSAKFSPLVNGLPTDFQSPSSSSPNPDPLYLFSFTTAPSSYLPFKTRTKYEVPKGLTEEYLLKFRYGRHDSTDLIDTLQEYWYDWGAFGQPLYKYQDLFPWDCTEAYGRYPGVCGECNIAKHVWAFPFDSWNIISLHLTRDRHMYVPPDPARPTPLSDLQWMRTRLTLLMALDALTTAAVAMARNSAFCSATRWLHSTPAVKADPALSRLKLGGIHRAQPFSHYFDQGTYRHYFIAEWAHLARHEQIARYEQLRDGRVKAPDVAYSGNGRFGNGDNGGDFDGFGGLSGGADGASADAGLSGAEANTADAGFSEMTMSDVGTTANCGSGCGSSACGASGCSGGDCGGGGGGCGGGGGGGCGGDGGGGDGGG